MQSKRKEQQSCFKIDFMEAILSCRMENISHVQWENYVNKPLFPFYEHGALIVAFSLEKFFVVVRRRRRRFNTNFRERRMNENTKIFS